ncbi:MAG: hypothetical protein QM473_23595 [Acidobacteriota bacterium]|nr:hypothetical protein [Acidobacteriota bacterium]
MPRYIAIRGILGAAALALTASGCCLAADTFFVSPAGNDAWSGTLADPNAAGTDGPFATLDKARDAARALIAAGQVPPGGITITVRGGVYPRATTFELTEADSGTAQAPVTFRAAPDEQVRLVGGITIPPEAFAPMADETILSRLVPEARGKVLAVDLTALAVTDLGQFPTVFRGAPAAPELFFDDQRMTLARWPNEGWATIARIVDTGSRPRDGDQSNRPGVFEYTEDNPSRWDVDKGVWLLGYWCYDWYAETLRVGRIDPETKQITLAAPTLYSVRQGNPSPRRYHALNVLEELDSPGEYYIDREANALYFWPPRDISAATITLSTLNAPVIAINGASHLVLRGFTVEAGLADGISVTGGEGVAIQACDVRNMRQLGIRVEGGLAHRVEACDIHHTGTGGLWLSGGDRKTLTPAGHIAYNNHIWRFSEHQLTYANGLTLNGVGNRAAHNLLHDAPHQAIAIGGNDHIFEFNEVHHICTETDDCGALYKGRDPSCRGNVIRYNFWHNIGSPMGHGNAAVYFDDGDGGDFVIGNVFFRCGEPGRGSFGTVFSHGGHGNLAENNIFIECKRALGSAPWNDKRWKDMINAELWQERLLKTVDITKPPYTTRYPELVGFMDPQPGQPRVNHAVRNLIVMCASVKSGNWQVSDDNNLVIDTDPGFVDAASGNFTLKPDAEVFAKLPGFQPVPFHRMGLQADALRPAPPAREWTYPAPTPLPPLGGTAAAAAPRVKTGPAPVFKVPRTTAQITIDGVIDPAEWSGAPAESAMPIVQDVMGNKANRPSKAWLVWNDSHLFIAVDNTILPATKLAGNQWGQDEAVEISVRNVVEGKATPISVLRGFGNGHLQFGITPNGDQEPSSMDPGGAQFKATRPAPDRWVAEFAIPLALLDIDPSAEPKVAFNITVRKAGDDLWLMWEGTQAHSYDVTQAGFIQFTR